MADDRYFATPKIVSRDFRTSVLNLYPVLQEEPGYFRFLEYLLFGAYLSESDNLIIPRGLIASFEGAKAVELLRSEHYSAEAFLKGFKARVLPDFSFSGYRYSERRAREVTNKGLGEQLEGLLATEIARLDARQIAEVDLVYFVTGKRANKQGSAQLRRELSEFVRERVSREVQVEAVRRVANYLNSLPPNSFSKLFKSTSLDSARQTARALVKFDKSDPTKVDQIRSKRSQDANLQLLRAIERQPKPYYLPSRSGATVRLYAVNESMLQLSGEVRKVLTEGWIDYDLRSSQLAIVASLWDIPKVNAYLEDGIDSETSIWDSLSKHLQIPASGPTKKALKECLYSLIYGMPPASVKSKFTRDMKSLGHSAVGKQFFTHPVIAALESARSKVEATVRRQGGITDVFGTFLALKNTKNSKGKEVKQNIDSLLAQQAQAMEFALVAPAFQVAKEMSAELTITLFQHDGFSVNYKASRVNIPAIEKKLVQAVDEEASRRDIITRLERST